MYDAFMSYVNEWRSNVPWQVVTYGIVLILAWAALAADSMVQAQRRKRIAKLLDAGYPARYRKVWRDSHE